MIIIVILLINNMNQPSPFLSLWYGGKKYRAANQGHVFVIYGSPGSGKSITCEPIIRSCLLNQQELNWEGNIDERYVLHIDNETPQDLSEEKTSRIYKGLSDSQKKRYQYINLSTKRTPDDKLIAIYDGLDTLQKQEVPLGLVIIDPISDIANDINNIKASSEVLAELNAYAEIGKFVLLIVAHTNRQGEIKGSWGSKILEKASNALKVVQNKDVGITRVSQTKERYGFLPPYLFKIREDKMLLAPYNFVNYNY